MPFIEIDDGNATYFDYHEPTTGEVTFVCCNSMGLTTEFWHNNIAPDLRERGFGTLAFDYRGQGQSRYDASATLEPDEIIGDIVRLIEIVAPGNPVLVGISIGGQYAAQAVLRGAKAKGLVMSNSLRVNGPHTEWLIEIEGRLLEMGGMRLANDAFSPSITSRERLAEMRSTHLLGEDYIPWPSTHPRVRIQRGLKKYKWDLRYEDLKLPVLVMTGIHDRLFRVQEDVEALLARLPDGKSIVFPDGGHVLHKELPDKLVQAFTEFAPRVSTSRVPC